MWLKCIHLIRTFLISCCWMPTIYRSMKSQKVIIPGQNGQHNDWTLVYIPWYTQVGWFHSHFPHNICSFNMMVNVPSTVQTLFQLSFILRLHCSWPLKIFNPRWIWNVNLMRRHFASLLLSARPCCRYCCSLGFWLGFGQLEKRWWPGHPTGWFGKIRMKSMGVPSGNDERSYWKITIEIVSFLIQNGGFPLCYISLC